MTKEIINRNSIREIRKDIHFLVEMEGYIDKMVGNFNLTDIQYVQTMVKNWLSEIREQLKLKQEKKQ